MDNNKIANELAKVAKEISALEVDQKKIDKFRRAKNKKPVGVLSFGVGDPMGNHYTYKMIFKYEETMHGDRFYAVERLTSDRMNFALSNMQTRPESFHTIEDVTFKDGYGDGEKMIELWFSGNARKFVTTILDEMLDSTPSDVARWLGTGVKRVTSSPQFKIIK